MFGFHARNGFYFRRMKDGSVRVTVAVTVRSRQFTAGEWEDAVGDAVLHEIVLPENEWASVVAAVSERGETSATWQEARDYHAKEAS